jgi:hypothetical protein
MRQETTKSVQVFAKWSDTKQDELPHSASDGREMRHHRYKGCGISLDINDCGQLPRLTGRADWPFDKEDEHL